MLIGHSTNHQPPTTNHPHTGAKVTEAYITEYSTDTIEMHADAVKPGQRVLLVGARNRAGGAVVAPPMGERWGRSRSMQTPLNLGKGHAGVRHEEVWFAMVVLVSDGPACPTSIIPPKPSCRSTTSSRREAPSKPGST